MIFKKNIADSLEDKIIDVVSKHKENMDYDTKSENARKKASKAENHMLGGLFTAAAGAVAGVGGLAASLHMGFGMGALAIAGLSSTVGGAILMGGVFGIAAPALAYMGISKLVKTYHESVANANDSLGGYRKEEFTVKRDFSKKITKALGGYGSELYSAAYSTGLIKNLEHGYDLEGNTKKLIELSKNITKEHANKSDNPRIQNFKDSLKSI